MPERPPERKEITVLEDIADGITIFAPPGGLPVIGPLTDEELRATSLAVAGAAAVGQAPINPPLSVSGVDGGGLKRHILTDTAGRVQVTGESTRAEQTQTIGSGVATGLATGAVSLVGRVPVGLWTPAAWTTAAITFQVSRDEGANWADLYDELGIEVIIPAASISTTAARRFALNPRLFIGVDRVRVRSGTGAAPITQAASRDIVLVARPIA